MKVQWWIILIKKIIIEPKLTQLRPMIFYVLIGITSLKYELFYFYSGCYIASSKFDLHTSWCKRNQAKITDFFH